jgi:hypothetical protein
LFEPTEEMLSLFTNDIYSTAVNTSGMDQEMEEIEISLPSVHDKV